MPDILYKFPPDLFNLMVDAIPAMCKSKDNVLEFFRAADVHEDSLRDLAAQVRRDRASISKLAITRTVLERLNAGGERLLGARRRVLHRITTFDNFDACWESDRHKAMALVGQIRSLVAAKDTVTTIINERDHEIEKHLAEEKARAAEVQKRKSELSLVKKDFFQLFSMRDTHKRGKVLEGVLNRLFELSGIAVREAFCVKGADGEGTVEQIDGVVEVDHDLYLVEMKWWNQEIGKKELAEHLVGVANRRDVRGIFISGSSFTSPALAACREFLPIGTIVLCTLQELVQVLERDQDLVDVLRWKIRAALLDKQPFVRWDRLQ